MSFIIPAVVEKPFENEIKALLSLVAHLKVGLGPKGPGPLGIPRRWCGGTSDMFTSPSAETLRALHKKPMSVGLSHHEGALGC